MEDKEILVHVSLLQILPYLPVKYNETWRGEVEITHATVHNRKSWGGNVIAFHVSKDDTPEKPWWYMINTLSNVNGHVILISKAEADRIGLKYWQNPKYPEHILDAWEDKWSGDERPAARKSAQSIIY